MSNDISEKDKKDWETFISSDEKLPNKDFTSTKQKFFKVKSIDLHGLTLEEANIKISRFINYCFENNVKKINVITGKGMRSKNLDDPYKSSDLSILKHSIPEFIQNDTDLMSKIIKIDFDAVNSQSSGNFDIFLKTIK